MKSKLFVIGSSHAANLHLQMRQNAQLLERFDIVTITRRGALFFDLYDDLPNPKVIKSEDVVLFQCFGNGLYKKWLRKGVRNVVIENVAPRKRQIHLLSFLPNDAKNIELEWDMAKTYLSSLNCKVYIIDNPY